uniref:BTB domain-containing protein n=1 Tax=Strigamia maritima TaxID=126957 RepID=T1ITG3_STRMM
MALSTSASRKRSKLCTPQYPKTRDCPQPTQKLPVSNNLVEMQCARNSKLDDFRQQQFDTDVVLECKEGNVHAHKLILMSTCTYFEKMFTSKMLEENSGHVHLTDISKQAIDIVVTHLYTVELPNLTNYHLLRELLETCHMMEMTNLLDHCWKEITQHHLNMETFYELWVVAVVFELERNSKMVNFIRKNFKEISKSEKLQNFTERQMEQLFESVDQKKYCSECVECLFTWRSNTNGEREKAAVNLLDKFSLKDLNETPLLNLLRMSQNNEKQKTIESVLIGESINRLAKKIEVSVSDSDSSSPTYSPGFPSYSSSCSLASLSPPYLNSTTVHLWDSDCSDCDY